jgi:hypothetical protein
MQLRREGSFILCLLLIGCVIPKQVVQQKMASTQTQPRAILLGTNEFGCNIYSNTVRHVVITNCSCVSSEPLLLMFKYTNDISSKRLTLQQSTNLINWKDIQMFDKGKSTNFYDVRNTNKYMFFRMKVN